MKQFLFSLTILLGVLSPLSLFGKDQKKVKILFDQDYPPYLLKLETQA